jgi:Icc-related predicted phosphoesterase
MLQIACVSDNHSNTPKLPKADVLVHSGDLTGQGTLDEIERGLDWIANAPTDLKIFVPGNHDWGFETKPDETRRMCEDRDIILLIDQEHTYKGVRFYGSPWQPAFCDWAFNLYTPEDLEEKWNFIPSGGQIDVLITHGPAYGILDLSSRDMACGCRELWKAIQKVKPRAHIFGHIHAQHGIQMVSPWECPEYIAVNASTCNERYQCINPIQVIWV